MSPAAIDADLLHRLRARLAADGQQVTPTAVAAALRSEAGLVGDEVVLDVVDALRRESVGAGPLEPLLARPGVTDVLVNGPAEVYVDDGRGLIRTEVRFPDDASVRRLAQRLAATAGRRLDDASPFVDVPLPDGTRFHAVLAPVARPGTCLSLRVPARAGMSLADLEAAGAVSPDAAAILSALVDSRVPFLVSGGTGSGKTTLLGAMLARVDARHRIVIAEDMRELRPDHPHVVSLEARSANVEGAGGVTLRDLVRQALRMRPDRLVVGEVRGAEVVDLLAALNTGHEGGCGTVHANAPADVPARLEALGVAAGLSREAVHAQVAAGLAAVVHLRRDAGGCRWVSEVGVVQRAGALVEVTPAIVFDLPGRRSNERRPAEPAGRLLEAILGQG
ncbi:MAG TPA: TadA family conjugal transfer-associated ATPase [Nocardioidaceae bacterium]|nr:TadA family conjugal transfer-associated ATPase [Nocardioidaceae bacterium]